MLPIRTGNPGGDMAAIMARVRKMSDAQLADILAGKDVSVPQFAAMTEAMGRKRLRTAIQGQQAQQQAQQPSVKDQLLAEEAGLAALPAPNMASMDMAAGGIVAFDEGGEVPRYQNRGLVLDPSLYTFGNVSTGYTPDPELERQRKIIEEEERIRAERKEGTKEFFKNLLKPNTVRMAEARGYNVPGMSRANAAAPAAAATSGIPAIISTAGDQAGDFPVRAGEDARKDVTVKPQAPASAPASAIDLSAPTKFERRASPFGEMSAEKVDVEGLKDRGLGEGLMRLGAGLMSAPGAKGLSAGIAALAEQAGLTRKEINSLKKDARDYDLNLKRAEAAFEQGQDELGLKYTEAANLNKFRMASLAQEPGELRTLKAIADNPQLAALYKSGKNANVISRTDALKEWNDLAPGDKRKLQGMGITDFGSYYNYLSTGLPGLQVVDTLGKDAKVRS